MNLNGMAYPDPHPAWGVCADELLFYTSRYAPYTTRRLVELGEGQGFDTTGFQARNMTPNQRACMARLLSFPPDPYTARAIGELAAVVAKANASIPEVAQEIAGRCWVRPYLQLSPARPRHSTDLGNVHPVEVLRHLGLRYGFSVRIDGHQVWVNDARCRRLLRNGPAREADNVIEALDALNRMRYEVHLDHPRYAYASTSKRAQAYQR